MPQEKPLYESKANRNVLLQYILFGGLFLLAGELLLYAYFTSMEEEIPSLFLILGFLFSLIGLIIGLAYFWVSPKIVASPNGFGLQGIGNTGAWRWAEVESIEPFVLNNWLGRPLPSLIIRLKGGKVLKLWDSSFQNLHEFRQLLQHFTTGNKGTFTPISYKTAVATKDKEGNYEHIWKFDWWRGGNGLIAFIVLATIAMNIYFVLFANKPWLAITLLALPFLISGITKSQYVGMSKEGLAFWHYFKPEGISFRKRHIQKVLIVTVYRQPLSIHLMTKDQKAQTFYIVGAGSKQALQILQQLKSIGLNASYEDQTTIK